VLRNFVTFGNDKKQIKTLIPTTMRKFFSIISATMFLFSVSAFTLAAQQAPDLQKEAELLKKADKKMQSGLAKCSKEMKIMTQKTEESLKNLNIQIIALKSNVDTLESHVNLVKTELTKKEDLLNSKIVNISIRLWLCVLILLLIAAYIFFGVIGAIKKNMATAEAEMLNDRKALEIAFKKSENDFNEKLHALEEKLTAFRK
jgi:polyhydroxyalkanoate synthesis regulator phasin